MEGIPMARESFTRSKASTVTDASDTNVLLVAALLQLTGAVGEPFELAFANYGEAVIAGPEYNVVSERTGKGITLAVVEKGKTLASYRPAPVEVQPLAEAFAAPVNDDDDTDEEADNEEDNNPETSNAWS
jgi:hypothetical protein